MKYFIGIALILIMGFLIGRCSEERKQPKEIVVTKTDTQWMLEYVPTIRPGGTDVLPNTLIRYRDTGTHTQIVKVVRDTVYNLTTFFTEDSTEVTYADNFLIKSKNDSKLINSMFSRDSIHLDLLNPDGKIETKKYLVYYDKYFYSYKDGQMQKFKSKTDAFGKPIKKFYTEANAYVSINPLDRQPKIAADYSLMFKRVGLFGNASYSKTQFPRGDVQVGIRVKLK